MPQQLTFDLPGRVALGREDFFVSSTNQIAVAAIDGWHDWPGGKMLLIGPAGSGKSHLAHVWAADAGARVVKATELETHDIAQIVDGNPHIALEDIHLIAQDAGAQDAAFHLHNLLLAEGGRLLLTSAHAPAASPMSLPDLQSRIAGTNSAQLAPPDDALLSAVMVKLFADRQVDVPLNVITYLAPRIERSIAGAAEAVRALDRLALAENRPITRALASRVMDNPPNSEA